MSVIKAALIGAAANEAATQTVRLPANLMGILRESYDSRQKVLDWMLSIAVVVVAVYAFWPTLKDLLNSEKIITPSQDVAGALPDVFAQPVPASIYTYNMPSSRSKIRTGIGPSATRPPVNPSRPPSFSTLRSEEARF